MYQNKRVTAVILAAGSSSRMGLNINKVYISTSNGTIVQYSLQTFDRHPYVDEIVMVVRREDEKLLRSIIDRCRPQKPVRIAYGGETRNDSVYNALRIIASHITLVHDGARPLVRHSHITSCVEAMDSSVGAVIAIKSREVISVRDGKGYVRETPDQKPIYMAQTPQCFHTSVLREAHETVKDKSLITDDSSLLEHTGHSVRILPGDPSNLKITTPQDLTLAIAYLEMQGKPQPQHDLLQPLRHLGGIALKSPKRA